MSDNMIPNDWIVRAHGRGMPADAFLQMMIEWVERKSFTMSMFFSGGRRKTLLIIFIRAIGFAVIIYGGLILEVEADEKRFREEAEFMAEIPEGSRAVAESVDARPDKGKVAFAYDIGEGFRVCMNDQCSSLVDNVARGMPVISPDGKHWAAVVQKNGRARVMLNGNMGSAHDMVYDLRFSPDSQKLVFVSRQNGGYAVHVNQEKHPLFPGLHAERGLIFSDDSRHLAYVALTERETWRVVKNGNPGPEYEDIKQVRFSPDSSRMLYAARKDGRWYITGEDGIQGEGYLDILRIVFGPDSEQLVYLAKTAEGVFAVHDGEPSRVFDRIVGEPMFSPDGNRLAYSVIEGDKMRMVVDGEPGPRFERIGAYLFSPDGSQFAYMAVRRGKGLIVHEGNRHKAYDSVGIPVFSPEGDRLAYMVLDGDKWHVWEGGRMGPGFDRVRNPVFCPGGERMAYLARQGEDYAVVEGDEVIGTYQWAGSLGFSPESRLVYAAAREEGSFLVVDEAEGSERFLSFVKGVPPVFVEDDVVHAIALREEGRKFYLLRAEIGK